jgi:hypothetical protein
MNECIISVGHALHQQEILTHVASFLVGNEVASMEIVSRCFRNILSGDKIWEDQCSRLGWKQLSATRTRGRRPWKDVYKSKLCVECRSIGPKGTVIFDISGGCSFRDGLVSTSLVALCSECLDPVQSLSRFSERKRCLPSR